MSRETAMNIGKALCACGMHAWSAIEPGTVHLTNGKHEFIGVLWAQVGTRACERDGCTATQQVVREGEYGFDGLNVKASRSYQVTDVDTVTGWGWSHLEPKKVTTLPPYTHPVAVERLGVQAPA